MEIVEKQTVDELFRSLIEVINIPYKNNTHNFIKIFELILNKTSSPSSVEDFHILDNFGTALERSGKLLEALCCFEEILKLNSNYLKSYQNLDNVKNQLVERWHFRMLNDVHRNAVYRNAIGTAIANGRSKVLDIGTGTGLLSLYSAYNGGTDIKACDDAKIMIDVASEVFKLNKLDDKISLINKYSHDLTEDAIGGRVDLVVTETLDSGVFGEGILQTLIHAKEHLLQADGLIIPSRVKLYIAGFECKSIASENVCINSSFSDLIYLKGHRLVAFNDEPYDTENVRQLKDFKIITKIEEAFECNFNDLDDMKKCLNGNVETKVRLEFERNGLLDGFVMWFSLCLDENNIVESKPCINSCWDQTIFKLNHRFANMEKLKYLNVTVSCREGMLNLSHYYNYTGRTFPVSREIIKFVNDTAYLNKLEFDFFNGMKQTHSKRFDNVLDFSPFPYIGISLLKEKRAKKLYCSSEALTFVSFVAACNCIDRENIVFIGDPVDVLLIPDMFDLMILSLVEPLGCVNSIQIANYDILKTNKLKTNGCIIPHKMELWTELIHSQWLNEVGKIVNPEMTDLHITELMNEFSTTNQLNLQSFEHEKLSNPFQLADIQLNDQFYTRLIKLQIKPTNKPVNGILYFYKIYVTQDSEPISTRRSYSYIKRACFTFDDFKCVNSKATVQFVQNNGVIKCCLR